MKLMIKYKSILLIYILLKLSRPTSPVKTIHHDPLFKVIKKSKETNKIFNPKCIIFYDAKLGGL